MPGRIKYAPPRPKQLRLVSKQRRPAQHGDGRYSHAQVEDLEYTLEELEFFRAVERFKADKHEPFPTLRDLLRIVTELGYTRPR